MLSHSFKLLLAGLMLVSVTALAQEVNVEIDRNGDVHSTDKKTDAATEAAKGKSGTDTTKEKSDADKKVTDALRNRGAKVGADQSAGSDVDATVRAAQAKKVEDAKNEAAAKPKAGGSRTKYLNSLDLDLKGEVTRLLRLDSNAAVIEASLHSDAAKAHYDRIVQYLNNKGEISTELGKFDAATQKIIDDKVADAAKTIANLVDVMAVQERVEQVNVDSLYEAVTTYLLGIEPPPANASYDDVVNNYLRAFNNWEAIQGAANTILAKNPGYDLRSAEYWATKGLIDKFHGDPSKPDAYWDEAKRKELATEIVNKGCTGVAG